MQGGVRNTSIGMTGIRKSLNLGINKYIYIWGINWNAPINGSCNSRSNESPVRIKQDSRDEN